MAVYIELSNPIHGGEGWELGEVLWSPVASSWNTIMRKPKEGDMILHSIKDKKRNINHRLWGCSQVAGSYKILSSPPPIPANWDGYDEYYQIPLKHYTEFQDKVFLQEVIDQNKDALKAIAPQKSFYTETGVRMQPAQKYLAPVSNELFEILTPYIKKPIYYNEKNKQRSENIVREGDSEELLSVGSGGKVARIQTTIDRIVRDTSLVKKMKQKYNNQCQICGKSISLSKEKYYSEGHHLKKLGGIHQGPDIESNIIILCPNHHVEFDYGAIAIDVHSQKIIHTDPHNPFHNKELAYKREDLNKEFLTYHLKNIFIG